MLWKVFPFLKSLWRLLSLFSQLSSLLKSLSPATNRSPAKPVSSPVVQFGQTVTQVVKPKPASKQDMYVDNINSNKSVLNDACTYIMQSDFPDVEKFLLILLLRNGLRVSEICNPNHIRVADKWTVFVWCTKNKSWRKCITAEAAHLAEDTKVIMDLSIWKRNRQHYYRKLKGLLAGIETSRIENTAVTHAARNIQAQEAFEITGSMEATNASIGNKSNNATRRYMNKSQRMAVQTGGIEDPISGTTSNLNMTKTGIIRRKRK